EGIAELIKSTVEDCVKKAIDSMNAEKAEKADDEDPDALIGELLDELTKESEKSEDEDPDATEDDSAEQEEALTVSAESMDSDNSGLGSVAHDSAIAILKNARPAIAKIKDKTERKRVVDVLIMAVKGQVGSGNQYQSIMKTTAGVAKRKALDSAAATIDTQAVQTAYDRCNPHKKGVQ
ncbi:MAG: hypothetical protein FWF82_07820, partial [Oscillospiraceae bacterium]|nr:hypothetical protein [Oscillospiraceae bacterium]